MTALDRLGDSPDVFYYRDFAALRRAQLGNADRSARRASMRAPSATCRRGLDKRFGGRSLGARCRLRAGCGRRRPARAGALAGARARRRQPADRARRSLGARARGRRRRGATRCGCREARDRRRGVRRLGAVDRRSRLGSRRGVDGDWPPLALERGQARTARDLIERALLLAPDYRAALDVRAALQSARSALVASRSHRCVLRRAGIRYAPWRSSSDSSNRAAASVPPTSRTRRSASARAAARAI